MRCTEKKQKKKHFFKKILLKSRDLTGVRMEKSRFSVKLCETSVRVDGSDVAVTFRLSLQRDEESYERVNIILKH